jgi:hypothetical protein
VVLVVLLLLTFITVVVWVRKHRTRERRSIVNVSCICDVMEHPFRDGPVGGCWTGNQSAFGVTVSPHVDSHTLPPVCFS